MRRLGARALLIAVFAALAAGSSRAQGDPASKVGALIEETADFSGCALTSLNSVPAPKDPAPIAPSAADSVVPPGLWATLLPPDAETLASLAKRAPDLDVSSVRVLTPEAAEPIFAQAAAKGLDAMDLFTDVGFRAQISFYLSPDAMQAMFGRYDIRVLTPPSGKTVDDKPFQMQALVIGRGRIDMFYDRDGFTFKNAMFENGRYTVSGRVIQRIQGPGDLAVEGLSLQKFVFTAAIRRITKLSPTRNRVDTSSGVFMKEVAHKPIVLRRPS